MKNDIMWELFSIIPTFDKILDLVSKSRDSKRNNRKAILKLVLDVLDQHILYLELDYFLPLKTNKKTDRIFHRGIPIETVFNASEKFNLIKTIKMRLDPKKLKKYSMTEVEKSLKDINNIYISHLKTIFDENIALRKEYSKHSKRYVLNTLSLRLLFNVIYNTLPSYLVYGGLTGESDKKWIRVWNTLFSGYKSGITELLRDRISIDYIHELEESPNWKHFIKTFRKIERKELAEMDKQKIGIFNLPVFKQKSKIDKNIFGSALVDRFEPKLTSNQKINEFLWWYDVEIIEPGRIKIFSGKPLFMTILNGEICERIRHGGKIEIIRIRHKDEEPTFYSYGILLERFGTLVSDLSGWIIISDCCGDYSGMGGCDELNYIMKNNEKYLNIREINITKRKFEEYCKSSLKSGHFKITSKKDLAFIDHWDIKGECGHYKGLFMELLTSRFFHEKGYETKFRHMIPMTSLGDIDVLAENGKEILFVEVSTHIKEEPDVFLKKFNEKIKIYLDGRKKGRIKKIYVTSKKCLNTPSLMGKIDKFKSSGMKILCFEEHILPHFVNRGVSTSF